MVGALALLGGAEFLPGNEPHDRAILEAARPGPRFVLATAAARQGADAAVATARRWFAGLGAEIDELRVRTRREALSAETASCAASAGLVYIAGGDPGLLLRTLAGSPVWSAVREAWEAGAALAGSSAGAMALCRCALLRAGWPDRSRRRPADALGLVPVDAFIPHLDTFGARWVDSALAAFADVDPLLVGVDERTAALWDGGRWRVEGRGRVVVLRRGARTELVTGDTVEGLRPPG